MVNMIGHLLPTYITQCFSTWVPRGSTKQRLEFREKKWGKIDNCFEIPQKIYKYTSKYRENFCPAIGNIGVTSVRLEPSLHNFIFSFSLAAVPRDIINYFRGSFTGKKFEKRWYNLTTTISHSFRQWSWRQRVSLKGLTRFFWIFISKSNNWFLKMFGKIVKFHNGQHLIL
jgi:hypothetical protein